MIVEFDDDLQALTLALAAAVAAAEVWLADEEDEEGFEVNGD